MGVDSKHPTSAKGISSEANYPPAAAQARKQRLDRRLDKFNFPEDLSQPMMRAATCISIWRAGPSALPTAASH
jgi:hypothetical protein